jgi:hypothetical protein
MLTVENFQILTKVQECWQSDSSDKSTCLAGVRQSSNPNAAKKKKKRRRRK